jgi:diguanylate cyclase (GGDEF)-like protein
MKILIAEDDRLSRRILETVLAEAGYEVVMAYDGREALRMLQAPGAPQVAILDWMMPVMDGIQVCQEVRRWAQQPYIYMLILTSRDRKQDVIEGLDAGADDYLVKPFDAHELRARLRAGCRIIELQNQLVAAREALREQATHDLLTGLWNRAAIFDFLKRELNRAERDGGPVSVVLADLDHFKQVNDTYGHLAGDVVLREAARRMTESLRSHDLIGRYGGEEFLLVLPGCDAARAAGLAERLRRCVGDQAVSMAEGAITATVSLGVAATHTPAAAEAEKLLRAADDALYRAKRAGRNRVESSQEVALEELAR